MNQQIIIDSRHRGTAGRVGGLLRNLLADQFDGPIEVSVRRMPRSSGPVWLEWFEENLALVCDGEHVIATVQQMRAA